MHISPTKNKFLDKLKNKLIYRNFCKLTTTSNVASDETKDIKHP